MSFTLTIDEKRKIYFKHPGVTKIRIAHLLKEQQKMIWVEYERQRHRNCFSMSPSLYGKIKTSPGFQASILGLHQKGVNFHPGFVPKTPGALTGSNYPEEVLRSVEKMEINGCAVVSIEAWPNNMTGSHVFEVQGVDYILTGVEVHDPAEDMDNTPNDKAYEEALNRLLGD